MGFNPPLAALGCRLRAVGRHQSFAMPSYGAARSACTLPRGCFATPCRLATPRERTGEAGALFVEKPIQRACGATTKTPEQIGGASSRSVNFLAAALKQAVAPARRGRCAPASRAPSPGPSLRSGCGLGCAPCLSRRLATRRNPARKPPALLSAKAPPIRPGGAVERQNRSSGEGGGRAAATQAAQEPIAKFWRL